MTPVRMGNVVRQWLAQVALVVALLGLCPGIANEAVAQAGLTVESIEFEGNNRYAGETLRQAMRTKEGQRFDRALLNEDIQALFSFFDSVDVREEQTPEGIRLVFVVSENPNIAQVLIHGVEDASLSQVEGTIDTRAGRPLASFRVENDARKVEQLYKRLGWHFVEVKTSVTERDGNAIVTFDILEGPRVQVDELVLQGNDSLRQEDLDDNLYTSAAGFLGIGGTDFVEEFLQQDLLTLANHYRAEGWLDARVELLPLEFSADRSEVVVRIQITEGQPYKVSSVKIVGAENYPGGLASLEERIRVDVGRRRRQERVGSTQEALMEAYREEGYFNVLVVPDETLGADHTVALTFRIEEQAKTFVRSLIIRGNTITQDKVIRREVPAYPGSVLNSNALRKGENRLRGLGYFSQVFVDVQDAPEGEDPNTKDVVIELEETARTGQMRFAAGVSSDLGIIGSVTVTKRNFDWRDLPDRFGDIFTGRAFSGAGQTFQLELAPGSDFSSYRLAFTEPWLFDKPISFGWDLFFNKFSRFDYDVDRQGLNLTLGKRWTLPGRRIDTILGVSGTTRIENVDVKDVDRDSTPTAFLAEDDNSLISQGISVRLDKTDSAIATSEGWLLQAGTEVGFAGDLQLWRSEISGEHYWTLFTDDNERKHILKVAARMAYASPLDGSDEADNNLIGRRYVPLYESYFTGGGSSVRGFEFGGAGPHGEGNPFLSRQNGESRTQALRRQADTAITIMENDGDPMGGNVLLNAGAEYSFPLFEDLLRGVLFVDSGMVRESFDSSHGVGESEIDQLRARLNAQGSRQDRRLARQLSFEDEDSFFSDLRVAVGFGLRIRIPIFGPTPIALDFGFPIVDQDGDDHQVLSFSIARDF